MYPNHYLFGLCMFCFCILFLVLVFICLFVYLFICLFVYLFFVFLFFCLFVFLLLRFEMYRYAMIGVSAFSDPAHFPNDDNSDSSDLSGRPRQNFDNFLHAALCVFQVCLPLSISPHSSFISLSFHLILACITNVLFCL